MKTLLLDIETAPNLAYVWGFWKTHVSPKQVVENSTLMSYAAKWLDDDQMFYDDVRYDEDQDEERITLALAELLDEADAIVAHNGQRFDLPKINTACLRAGINPPSPVKVIDTLLVAKREFKFDSNKLEHLAEHLNLPMQKLSHQKFPGVELWRACLAGNEEAWEEMKEYNIHDVLVLEHLYIKLRPWMRQHPVVGNFTESKAVQCPKCGSAKLHYRGYAYTNVGKFRKFQCQDCGGWGRHRTSVHDDDKKKVNVVNVY